MEIALTCSDIDRLKSWLNLSRENHKVNGASCIDYSELFELVNKYQIAYIYFGASFCQYKLPSLQSVKEAIEYCDDNGITFVLLTPPLSEYGLTECEKYIDYFISINRCFDIVVNDVGLVHMINKLNYKGNIIWGRVMDKTIHDSRLTDYEAMEYYSASGYEYMHALSTEASAFKKFLRDNKISRVEYDGDLSMIPAESTVKYEYIYPTEYLTTGRNCLFKIAGQSKGKRFLLTDTCSHLCKEKIEVMVKQVSYVKLDHDHRRVRENIMLRNGNTIFGIHERFHPSSVIDRLVLDIDNVF